MSDRDAGELSPIRMRMSFEEMPLDLAVALMEGIDRAAEQAGFRAWFREETGFDTLYFSRIGGDE
jgi:hypothetical protein